jgi:hypothetical protein
MRFYEAVFLKIRVQKRKKIDHGQKKKTHKIEPPLQRRVWFGLAVAETSSW